MQDRKALQAGTSHFLGQNFARAAEIEFQTREGGQDFAWTTSWGVSTRLIGGMIMVHGDDNGMIMPPRLAPNHVVLLPIIRAEKDSESVLAYCDALADALRTQQYHGRPLSVVVDKRDMNAGEKGWEWVKKGIPLMVEIGPRDIANNAVFVGRRDKERKERYGQQREEFVQSVPAVLDDMQRNLFERARTFRDEHTRVIEEWAQFQAFFTPQNAEKPEIHGGFALSHWCGDPACEARINDELSVTIRCIPFDSEQHGAGKCMACGRESTKRVVFAKAY